MSEAGERLIEGVKEMLAIAKGEQPAARVTIKGHAYVPATALAAKELALKECLRVLQQTPDRLRSNAHKNAIGQARSALED